MDVLNNLPHFSPAFHFTHFSKVFEMKIISEPLLAIEIYSICQNLSPDHFKKS